jgi:hypothetical protein
VSIFLIFSAPAAYFEIHFFYCSFSARCDETCERHKLLNVGGITVANGSLFKKLAGVL